MTDDESEPELDLIEENGRRPDDDEGAATTSATSSSSVRWKGFVAGTLSGLTKACIGHPFDTLKIRMQCSALGTYKGPLDCFRQTVSKEGFRGLYKGLTPPLAGWGLSDSILLGSLHNYRLRIAKWEASQRGVDVALEPNAKRPLSLPGHVMAGVGAGWTVCVIATPMELVKAKLQLQTTGPKLYTGPIHIVQQIVKHQGPQGLYHAFFGTLLFRTSFGAMFGSYEVLMRAFRSVEEGSKWKVSEPTANFLSGGLASNAFWLTAFPFDAVKNRMMADSITQPKYSTWMSSARSIATEGGARAFYRGFVPCLLRAFPTNASALFVWESTMRLLKAEELQK